MAKKKTTPVLNEPMPDATVVLSPPEDFISDDALPLTTGRYVIIFKDEAADVQSVKKSLREITGSANVTSTSDFESMAVTANAMETSEVTHFEELGVAIVAEGSALESLSASVSDADSPILAIEPEYIAYLSDADTTFDISYLRGYRDAVNHLYDQLTGQSADEVSEADVSAIFQDTAQFTWGLQATGVNISQFSGQGIRVAVLDTGFDLQHPDFRGRTIVSQSFTGFPVQDIHGHGTHCVGTACGPQRPPTGVRRYGVAYNAQIYVGKVFNNTLPRPGAPTSAILSGIEWALANKCRVASLSLGSPMNQKNLQYEVPMRRALNAGMLVVAAAGNNASRPGNPGFVEPPANADAVMAVAAVDNRLQIASFSGRSSTVTGEGGKVNIAGPGVSVFSSVPVASGLHAAYNGTSMATPHVAGIAALWAQATGESGAALWSRLVQSARPLTLASVDVGAGMVQAPR